MSQHTKGPWQVDYDNGDEASDGQWFNVGPAKIWWPYNGDEVRAKADTALVSAAPELLAALVEVLPHAARAIADLNAQLVGDLYPRINLAMLDRAESAVRKATALPPL